MVRSERSWRFALSLALNPLQLDLLTLEMIRGVEIRLTLNFVPSSLNSVREVATLNVVEGAGRVRRGRLRQTYRRASKNESQWTHFFAAGEIGSAQTGQGTFGGSALASSACDFIQISQ